MPKKKKAKAKSKTKKPVKTKKNFSKEKRIHYSEYCCYNFS